LVVDLGEAVDCGDAQTVADLIRAGADTEAVEDLNDPTMLMRAAEAGNLDVVRALVEGGANVNARAEDLNLDRLLDADAA
jgi:ankyrin repeat protein